MAFGSVVMGCCGRQIIVSLCNFAFKTGEMRRPFGVWSSTESKDVECEVIANDPVGMASRSGLIGWVV
jgi:hypothetical protein